MVGDAWVDLGVVAGMTDFWCLAKLGIEKGRDDYTILAGGTKGGRANVIRSINSGYNWTDLGIVGFAGQNRAESFCNRGSGRVFIGVGNNNGGIYESTDWGNTWTSRLDGMDNINAIENCKLNTMCAGCDWTGVERLGQSTDDGVNWNDLGSITLSAAGIECLYYIVGQNILLAGTERVPNPAKICRSTNKGAVGSWADVYNGGGGTVSIHCFCEGADGVIVAGQDYHIQRSIDHGATWNDQGQVLTAHINDIAYFGNGIFVGITGNGHAIRSLDNGVTWSDIGEFTAGGALEAAYTIINVDDTYALAGSAAGHLYRSGAIIPTPPVPPPTAKYKLVVGENIFQCEADKQELLDFNFTWRRDGGCAEFDFRLGHPFFKPVNLNEEARIYLYGQDDPWFRGRILERDRPGSSSSIRKYSGYGHLEILNGGDLVDVEYGAGFAIADLRLAIIDILDTYVRPYTAFITNDDSKISDPSYTIVHIKFDKVKPLDALRDLVELAQDYEFGVDEHGDFFFRPNSTDILQKVWVGKHVKGFLPTENMRNVTNYLYLEGGQLTAGSNYDSFVSDAPSIALYGRRSDKVTIPSGMDTSEIARWGGDMLEETKDSIIKGAIVGIDIERTQELIYPRGLMRVTSEDGRYIYDFPIIAVTYHVSPSGVTADVQLGEKVASTRDTIYQIEREIKKEREQLAHDVEQLASGAAIIGIWDADHDTGIQVEEGADDDTIRFDVAGTEVLNATATLWKFNEAGADVDFSWEAIGADPVFFIQGSDAKIGIRTGIIPHGGIGYATLAIDGPNASGSGPHVQFTTVSDDYPLFQILPWAHDAIGLGFDCYYDGTWRSSDVGSNFRLMKGTYGDVLTIEYDSAIVPGNAIAFNVGIAFNVSGGVGIGTSTIPHGGVGAAKFAIEGTDSSTAGPHIQLTTATDDYPLIHILPWAHDGISIAFDAYYDGAWKSSDAGSSFRFQKLNDIFRLQYDVVAAGGAITWNNGLTMDTAGYVGVGGQENPDRPLHVIGRSDTIRIANVETDDTNKYAGLSASQYDSVGEPEGYMLIYGASGSTYNYVTIGGSLSTANAATLIRFHTAANATTLSGTEAMRIDSSQRVGIGLVGTLAYELELYRASAHVTERIACTGDYVPALRFKRSSGVGYTDREWRFYLGGVGEMLFYDVTGTQAVMVLEAGEGGVGIKTTSVPHASVGCGSFAIEGANTSFWGPHIQLTTATNNYPLLQVLAWEHDNVSISFDSYYHSDSTWKSSDPGSSFQILKLSDSFQIHYDVAAAGSAVTWNDGIVLDTSGRVTKPNNVAFSAYPSAAQTNLAINTEIDVAFGTERFDVGSNFAANIFTAPVTGKYLLTAQLRLEDIDMDVSFYRMRILTSNEDYDQFFDPDAFDIDAAYFFMTMTVVADMDASDTAKVTIYQGGGAAQTDIEVTSYFMGYLLG